MYNNCWLMTDINDEGYPRKSALLNLFFDSRSGLMSTVNDVVQFGIFIGHVAE
jgi:hypothetical protein